MLYCCIAVEFNNNLTMIQFNNLLSPHNLRPTTLKFRGVNNITRIISAFFPAAFRIVLVLLILAAFGMAISEKPNPSKRKVLGQQTKMEGKNDLMIDKEAIDAEIKKTRDVIYARPDYAGAWLRLSVLYEGLGESDLAEQSRETAKNLDPDL